MTQVTKDSGGTAMAAVGQERGERRGKIREAFLKNPSQMTVVLARQLGVPEVEVVDAVGPEMSTELDAGRWEEILRSFEELGQVHVICSNSSVTLEVFGQFGNFSTWGDFFNVQSKTLDMHLRPRTLARVFAVEKPSHMDGVSTLSFQFFNQQGEAAFKVFLTFGSQAPTAVKQAAFAGIRRRFAR
ncbi:MAG: hypothetical protein IT443_10095 [Phycisphaeraceae bacterium]|nr:hypothetical protein [Phycisphaeraceae bacterium]